ncbi:MAG: CCA tRNA nucleotidyltransferase [Candidatus Bipolaricaulota bacterium]|nr:CCA tRNA nucleotidyltransferase [Candidatus Bipolaricaulota bacterium]MCS7274934.1 CCA tRNA nucleotidyltransferase [Candidatus Bipolaricaulota bacterium]MDW8110549.1 CCA tRNA nucleotidyltransferase [Candidatus Bipolaricaulota bacterium]MDW8329817.1 CCA tRNA nucleotidyltransferase [Candidatus Bipolaricaulota bacterium]
MNSIDVEKIFRAHPYAKTILERLTQAGFEAVMVGGIVRDALREQFESDYEFVPDEVDIATAAQPDEIRRLFSDTKIIEVGEAFGVLLLLSPDGRPYEVATFRRESEYDGRWPGRIALVRRLEDDVRRRDLTINGLAATLDGRVIDLVGGVDDLRAKRIRTIGDPDERLREDFLRILRVIRLACALDGQILPEVSDALRRHREGLRLISAERIRDELMRILKTPRAAKGIRLLDEHGLLELLLPEVAACKGVPQPEKYHPEGDVYTHTLLALECADKIIKDPLVKLAVLLHDIGKPVALEKNNYEHAGAHEIIGERMSEKICRRLRLSVEEIRLIKFLVREHLRIGKFAEMSVGKRVALLRTHEDASVSLEHFPQRFSYFSKLLALMVCDCEASAHRSSGWLPVLRALIPLLHRLKEIEERERARKLLDGHDLIALGLKPGPRIREILDAVYEKIFSGEITTREGALAEAQKLLGADHKFE